jgi:type IV pilus assembly protein PilW
MVLFCRKYNISSRINEAGFTLVELMIALFISALVMATVVTVYTTQSRRYSEHDDLANIQQDLRGVLIKMPAEIRLAGCDPTESGVPRIVTATSTLFRFTMDIEGSAVAANPNTADGVVDANENIAYGFAPGVAAANGVVVGGGTASLGRHTGIGALKLEPLADNIEALEFNYILDDGDVSIPDIILCNGKTTTSLAPAATDLNKICGVQVSILARVPNPSQGFTNMSTYTTASGAVWTPPQDNFRRRLVVSNVQLRNTGL